MSDAAPALAAARRRAYRLAVVGMLLAALVSGFYWLPLRAVAAAGVADLWACAAIALLVLPACLPLLRGGRVAAGAGRDLVLIGLLIGGAFACYTASLLLTDVVRALLLFYIAPAWSTLLEVLVLGRRLTLRRAAALLLGAAGLWTILGGDGALPLPRNAGDWLALVAGLLWSLGSLVSFRRTDLSTGVQTLALALGALAISLALALLGVGAGPPDGAALLAALPWLLFVALILTLPMWFLTIWGVRQLAPARATLLFMLEVCVGVLSAAVLTAEAFGWREAIGMVLVLAAAAVELVEPEGAQ